MYFGIAKGMRYTVLALFLITAKTVAEIDMGKVLIEYFKSDIYKTSSEKWQVHKTAMEKAISLAVSGTFKDKPSNLFHKKPISNKEIPDLKGFYTSDQVVNVLFMDLKVRHLPIMYHPAIDFELDNNRIHIQAHVTNIYIDGIYKIFRNKSSIVSVSTPDFTKHSPFSLEEVNSEGNVTLVLQNCDLRGSAVTSLVGYTVNLGFSFIKLQNCMITVEIYNDTLGSPPIIAPYFTETQSALLTRLLHPAIVDDMLERVQAAFYSYINTTTVYGKDDIMIIRHHQEKLFKTYGEFTAYTVSKVNALANENVNGKIQLEDLACTWDEDGSSSFSLTDLTLNGLDGAYSSNEGGPYLYNGIGQIGEYFKFKTLQVHGNFHMKNNEDNKQFEVAIELIDITMELVGSVSKLYTPILLGNNLRLAEFSMKHDRLGVSPRDRLVYHSLISGHIANELNKHLPPLVTRLLYKVMPKLALNKVVGNDDEGDRNNVNYDNVEDSEVLKEDDKQNNDANELEDSDE